MPKKNTANNKQRYAPEEALQASEVRFHAALTGSPIFVYEMDDDLRYRWVCNPPPPLSPAEWIGRRDDETAPPEHAGPRMAAKRQVLETGRGLRIEVTHDIGSEVRAYDLTLEPLRDVRGLVVGLRGAALDITERKRTEERLRASEARFRTIVEDQTEFISRFTPGDFTITFINRAYAAQLGRPREALLGTSLLALMNKGQRACFTAQLAALTPERPTVSYEMDTTLPDGSPGWEHWTDRALFDDAGHLVEYQSVGRDITERKRAEEALREAEALFRTVADGAPVLIWMSGPDKGGTWFNNAWLAFTGRAMADELGEGWLAGVHPEDLPALRVCADAFDARRPFTTEFRLKRRDGAWRWVLDIGVPRFGSKGFQGFIGSCVDITERKAAEERQRLLLAELSHRVKNTLAVVQGIANRSLSGDRTLAEGREALAKRLRALANAHTLLTASEWRGASLRALVAAELDPYRGRAAMHGQDLALGPKAAQNLALIVHELATNAAKHGALSTPDGRVELAWDVEGPMLRLAWREADGPEVRPPARHGFGRLLVEEAAAHDLGGRARLDFRREGLAYKLEVPLARLATG